jgi:hypothetical protein
MTKPNYKKARQLRNKDPKGTTTTKHKDGQKFVKGKSASGKPKVAKKNLKCFNRGGYVTCVDKSKPKKANQKKNTGTGCGKGGKQKCYVAHNN